MTRPEGTPADPAAAEGEGTLSPEEQLGIQPPALPFSYDDVPETLTRADATTWLRAREAQMTSGFTKAVNEALEVRRQAEGALTWQQRLEDEESRREAIEELLQPYGIELEWPDAEVEGAEPMVDDTGYYDAEVAERLDRVEQYVEVAADAQEEAAWINHVTQGLDAFARREGIQAPEGMEHPAEAIPKPIRDTILHHAMQLPRTPEGQLDIEAAVGAYDEAAEVISRSRVRGYIGSKDTPTISLGGGSAQPRHDLSTQRGAPRRGQPDRAATRRLNLRRPSPCLLPSQPPRTSPRSPPSSRRSGSPTP